MTTGNRTPDRLFSGTIRRIFCTLATPLVLMSCTMGTIRSETPPAGSVPMISFVFDDGNDTDYLVGREVFTAHGAVASSAVTTGFINTADHMTADQIRALQDSGWEIMGHTVTHPNLKALSRPEIETELAESKKTLQRLGLKVSNIVYPYNKNDETVRHVAARYYRSGRGGTNSFNDRSLAPCFIRSFALKHDTGQMERLIDRAFADRKWLVLYQHEINAKVKVSARDGAFRAGETLRLFPSGATGRYVTSHWFPLYGSAVYLVPLSGVPRPGDLIKGEASGATATLDSVIYNEREQLGEMLSYIAKNYPTMPVVTIDKGLDLLGIPGFQDESHDMR